MDHSISNNIEPDTGDPSLVNDHYKMPQYKSTQLLTASAERCARWRSGAWFRVALDLRLVCAGVRARALAWVCARRRARELLARARRLGARGALALRARGALLPPGEPLALLDPDDVVQVVPLENELPIDYEEESDIEDTYCSNCSATKNNKKRQHDDYQKLSDVVDGDPTKTRPDNLDNRESINSDKRMKKRRHYKCIENDESLNEIRTKIHHDRDDRPDNNEESRYSDKEMNGPKHRRFTFDNDEAQPDSEHDGRIDSGSLEGYRKHNGRRADDDRDDIAHDDHAIDPSEGPGGDGRRGPDADSDASVDALERGKRSALELLERYDAGRRPQQPPRKRRRVRRRRRPAAAHGETAGEEGARCRRAAGRRADERTAAWRRADERTAAGRGGGRENSGGEASGRENSGGEGADERTAAGRRADERTAAGRGADERTAAG
ncbi:uncharacterized protein ACR2FA_010483 [Aphomia sociella]